MRVSASFAPVFCIWLLAPAATAQEHHDHHHVHGEAAYEWAGIFEVPESSYVWSAQKVEGKYAAPSMKMALLPAAAATAEALGAVAHMGAHSLAHACVAVKPGGVVTPT